MFAVATFWRDITFRGGERSLFSEIYNNNIVIKVSLCTYYIRVYYKKKYIGQGLKLGGNIYASARSSLSHIYNVPLKNSFYLLRNYQLTA